MKENIWLEGIVVGWVEDGVFYKRLQPEHFLRIPPAISNNVSVLKDAMDAKAIYVCIIDEARNREWWATIDLIWKKGSPEFERKGYGRQIYLKLQYWTPKRPTIQQMSFMEAV